MSGNDDLLLAAPAPGPLGPGETVKSQMLLKIHLHVLVLSPLLLLLLGFMSFLDLVQ